MKYFFEENMFGLPGSFNMPLRIYNFPYMYIYIYPPLKFNIDAYITKMKPYLKPEIHLPTSLASKLNFRGLQIFIGYLYLSLRLPECEWREDQQVGDTLRQYYIYIFPGTLWATIGSRCSLFDHQCA